jgi:hypothetical protein
VFGDVTFAQSPFASLGGATFGVDVSESATGNNAQSVLATFVGVEAETAVASSVQSVIASFVATYAESASATATFDTVNNVFNVTTTESAVASSSVSATATIVVAVAEAASGLDSYVARSDLVAFIEETGLVFEQFTTARFVTASLAEGATAADALQVRVIFAGLINEAATGTDAISAIKSVNAFVTGIQLVVNIGNVLIWAQIDDSQNANWQNITTTQGSGWTLINDEQTPGWTNIPS